MDLCPTCHSPINVTLAEREELREDWIFTWTDDPLLTEQGLAGEIYKGLVKVNWQHIKEIQDVRTLQEEEAEVGNKTTFSEISVDIPVKKQHILELRQSTEKILAALNSTLFQYFNHKIEDNTRIYTGTYAYGEKVEDKTGWTDSDLTEIKIRAIHIEELRCPILLEVEEEYERQWIELRYHAHRHTHTITHIHSHVVDDRIHKFDRHYHPVVYYYKNGDIYTTSPNDGHRSDDLIPHKMFATYPTSSDYDSYYYSSEHEYPTPSPYPSSIHTHEYTHVHDYWHPHTMFYPYTPTGTWEDVVPDIYPTYGWDTMAHTVIEEGSYPLYD